MLRPGRRLAVDVGQARVGLAATDIHAILASPLATVARLESTTFPDDYFAKRLAAPLAQALYEETSESQTLRLERAELRKMNNLYAPHPDTKPDKKMRRQLLLLKSQQS